MNRIDDISPDDLRKIFDYDPDTGILKKKKSGKPTGWLNTCGHLRTWALGRHLLVHRVAFAVYHGRWPSDQIDHINGNPKDNRIKNLREATNAQNTRNGAARKNSKTGVLGVSWSMDHMKFHAAIGVGGKQLFLGAFEKIEDAAAARKMAELKYHGQFASHISRGNT